MRELFQAEEARVEALMRSSNPQSREEGRALIERILAAVKEGQPDWEQLFSSALETIGEASGKRLIQQFVDAGLLPPETQYLPQRSSSLLAKALAEGVANQRALQTVQTTINNLSEAFSADLGDIDLWATIDARPVDDLIATLESTYDDWLAGRASTITDMQVVGSWSLGELDAAFQSYDITGTQAIRTWVTMGDDRVRTSHADADGDEAALDEPFQIGDEELMYPGDPSASLEETAGCRCWLEWSLAVSQGDDAPIDPMGDPIDPDDLPIDG